VRVVVWSALGRIGNYATGVGKHVLRMSTGLAGRPDYDTRLLFTSDLWRREQAREGVSLMDDIPGIQLPFSRRICEGLWRVLNRPKVDRWIGEADWVYCPKELYIPVGCAKYAVTVHDVYRLEPAFRRRFSRGDLHSHFVLRRALQEANVVLSVSEFTKGRIVELTGVPPDRIRVVGNGADDGFFEIAHKDPDRLNDGIEQPYLLSLGGVTRKKGGTHILAVAAELWRRCPSLRWIIVGPVAPEFTGCVASAPNICSVQRGFPDSDMHRLVRGAIAVLVLSEYEGFGIPVVEAMAAGVPVIAARRASLPEVVGDTGILVEPTEVAPTVTTILDLIADRDYRERLTAEGRKRAEQFRWRSSVNRLVAALEEFGGRPSNLVS
jgi:glycosyltransferase involved in cell wall biosynthesis